MTVHFRFSGWRVTQLLLVFWFLMLAGAHIVEGSWLALFDVVLAGVFLSYEASAEPPIP